MKFRYVTVLVASLLMIGCDNASKFDGSSQESLQYSGEKIINALPDDKKQELKDAINVILNYYGTEAVLNNDKNYSPQKMRLVIMDDKTAEQIIDEAAEYKEKTEKLKSEFLNKH